MGTVDNRFFKKKKILLRLKGPKLLAWLAFHQRKECLPFLLMSKIQSYRIAEVFTLLVSVQLKDETITRRPTFL